jgi:single-strand DNA-binding protein
MNNFVQFEGHLGADPEVNYSTSGMCFASARLAISNPRKNKDTDEWEYETSWANLKFFGKQAEWFSEQCVKGDKVQVDGKFKVEEWDDKDSGDKRSKAVFVIDRFHKILKPVKDD